MEETSIQKLTKARNMLAEARTMDDILHIRDIAESARVYAQAARLGLESQNEAAEIKMRAERKAGELLAQMPMNEGTRLLGGGDGAGGNIMLPPATPTLSDLGIEKMQSSRWQQIARLPEEKFESFIRDTRQAGQELTSIGAIREYKNIEREQMHANKRIRPLPVGKYSVIYADPPWQYDNNGLDTSAEMQYPTMPIDEICSLTVGNLTEDTSILFLWATNPLLPDALQVIDAWGFKYKTNLVWIKGTATGIGWFEKSAHEILIIAVKDKTPHPQERPVSYFQEQRTVHSRKPETAYKIIESMYPGNKIELFARESREGWSSWGNEEL